MKKVFKKIVGAIKNFLNRMTDQEAKRIIFLYNHIL